MDASHSRCVASKKVSVLSRFGTALCAAAVLFAGTVGAANAQPDPAPAPAVAPAAVAPITGPAVPALPVDPAPNADAPKTVGQTPSAPPVRTGPPPLGHWPIIDFVVTFTQPAYYGNRFALPTTGLSPINRYDPLDLGGTVRIPVTRKFNLLFDRITEGTVNQPLECVLQPAVPGGAAARVCASDSRDIILQYHATYAFDRFVTLDVGDSFRHRIWTNGGNGVSTVPFLCDNNGRSFGANCTVSSTEHHFGYAGLTYTTKPWKDLWNSVFALTETLDRQNVDHHVGMVCSSANLTGVTKLPPAQFHGCSGVNPLTVGYYDENPSTSAYWETTQGVTWILPLDPKHGTTLSVNERWGALNFYENPGIFAAFGTTVGEPYRWTSANAITLSKRFSPGFTLAMRHQDYHSVPQGTPFVAPNAIHVGSWDVLGTFHMDTNTFFH